MTLNRIDQLFTRLKSGGRKVFATYFVAGDPDLEASLALMHGLVASGIDLIEIGHPFTDPILDGATIQRANARALLAGGNLPETLRLCARFRARDMRTPLVLMGYANPIAAMGYEAFAAAAARAGIDGLIAADFPLREAATLLVELARYDLRMIPLAAPNLDPCDYAMTHPAIGGFLYCIPVIGPTGGPSASLADVSLAVDRCRAHSPLPVMVGFGVKTPEMAMGIASVADGVIVATALMDRLDRLRAELPDRAMAEFLDEVRGYRQSINSASKPG